MNHSCPEQPSILTCPRCSLVNAIDIKFCSKCSYPLTPKAYEEIKENEDLKLKSIQDKHEQDMKDMRVSLAGNAAGCLSIAP